MEMEGGCCVIVYIVGDFTCKYLSGCGRYHFADMILEKNKKSTCNLYTLMLNYNANAL